MIISRLEYLFTQHYLRTISQEEEIELTTLLDDDSIKDDVLIAYQRVIEKNTSYTYDDKIINDDNVENQIKNIISIDKNQEYNTRISYLSNNRSKFIWIAASLISILFATLWLYKEYSFTAPHASNIVNIKEDFSPGKDGAVLSFSDGTKIIVDSLGNSREMTTIDGSIIQIVNGQIVYKSSKQIHSTSRTNSLSTPKGRRYQLSLADGTKVFLNAASTITFPTIFDGDKREVTITGEAYFEVAKDVKKPFIVRVQNKPLEIRVLGTHFNLKAYDNDIRQYTTLLEGKVNVINRDNSNIINPLQQVISTQNQNITKELSTDDVDNIMAWKENRFAFNNVRIDEVLIELARWYDFEVKFEGDIPTDTYSGKIDKDLTFKQVLNLLGATKLKYKITNENQLIIL